MTADVLKTSPFDPNRYMGSVIFVGPDSVRINLPYASSVAGRQYAGYSTQGGQVGEFLFIETEDYAILGRVIEVKLPDNERLNAEPKLGKAPDAHPIGFAQLLTTLKLTTGEVVSGIAQHPRIGQHAFSAHPALIKHIVEGAAGGHTNAIELATTGLEGRTIVNVPPSKMFGRHCAILGATGGGKSWTVARVVQQVARLGGKVILIDPTGEFYTFATPAVHHVFLGGQRRDAQDERRFTCFPYWMLSDLDLFAMFRPSGGSQGPKLREALISLKLAYAMNPNSPGLRVKRNADRATYKRDWAQHQQTIEAPGARYQIKDLPKQISEECVWDHGGTNNQPNYDIWGGPQEQTRGFCEPLSARIYSIVRSAALRCLFEPEEFLSLTDEIESFMADNSKRVLRISMESLPFEHNARELLTNAIGRYLLGVGRRGGFLTKPCIVVLDEAHQFLNKSLGDEANTVQLDAFGLIAKEGRKYGITTILATQRPRDIPEDVLSQMGMFLVHRLINDRDREVVEKACGSLDKSAAAFLPTLGQGEAILVGVDFPMPTPIRILPPAYPPQSNGPDYARHWTSE